MTLLQNQGWQSVMSSPERGSRRRLAADAHPDKTPIQPSLTENEYQDKDCHDRVCVF